MIQFTGRIQNWRFQRLLKHKIKLSDRQRHIYITGKTGSGKSELMKQLIYGEIRSPKPKSAIVLLDPHGDMTSEIARFKEFSKPQIANRLVYIDPSLSSTSAPTINPFAFVGTREEDINLMVQELIKILNVLLNGTATTNQMNAILAPCLHTILRRSGQKPKSFLELKRFMNDQENHDLIEEGLKLPNQIHREFFRNKFRSKALAVSKHAIEIRLQVLLNDPIFQRLISGSYSIDLEQLIKQRKIIIFRLTLGELGSESVEAYGRFIVALLKVIALKRARLAGYLRTPTYLFIDEFHNFVSPDIEKALTQLRKYRLYLVLASQYIGQCGSAVLQKALLGVGVIIAGQNECKSRKAIEAETGIASTAIENLKSGEFFVKSGIALPFQIQVPRYLLKNAHAMSQSLWRELKKIQLSKYYFKEIFTFEPNKVRNFIDLAGLTPKY